MSSSQAPAWFTEGTATLQQGLASVAGELRVLHGVAQGAAQQVESLRNLLALTEQESAQARVQAAELRAEFEDYRKEVTARFEAFASTLVDLRAWETQQSETLMAQLQDLRNEAQTTFENMRLALVEDALPKATPRYRTERRWSGRHEARSTLVGRLLRELGDLPVTRRGE